MATISLGEQAALQLVLSNMTVKDLLHFAIIGLSQCNTTQELDQANICSQAITSFLD